MATLPLRVNRQAMRPLVSIDFGTIGIFVAGAFAVPAMMVAAEYDWLENTLGARSLIAWSVAAGLLAAAAIGRTIPTIPKQIGHDSWMVPGIVAIPCVLLSIAVGSLSNRLLPTGYSEREFSILSKEHHEAGYRSPAEWLITVQHKNDIETLKIDQATFAALDPGGVFHARVIIGRWGQDILPPPRGSL